VSTLLSPLTLRGQTFANRAWVSPMCQYSCDPNEPGLPTDWHAVHLGGLALGGPGLVMAESTAVLPEGRITPWDTGVWDDAQAEVWQRIASFSHTQDVPIGLQLGHAGRKASNHPTWTAAQGSLPLDRGGWPTVGPSAVAYGSDAVPREMDESDIAGVVAAFAAAAARAAECGFDVIEVHAAHGYLLHQFLSPLSNHRSDAWGGSFENRIRLALEVVRAVRDAWPDARPLFVRISATDWVEGGWSLEDSVALAVELRAAGVDLVDCSSGGSAPDAVIPVGPGYQVGFAREIRAGAGIATSAVGRLSEVQQAEEVLASGSADAVMMARAFLSNPRWAQAAARELGEPDAVGWPAPYHRVAPASAPLHEYTPTTSSAAD
jgi:2,4-dienoyl-CoA reductase-like NADH-dependent reductase (Old Yellow Enzyme family)